MLFVHENNINNKISENYKGKAAELMDFKENIYSPFKEAMLAINFSNGSIEDFRVGTEIFNEYYNELSIFIRENGITAQSKLESTFLEELSVYLFKNIEAIVDNRLDFYNRGIYAGLKINPDLSLGIIKKDVDFCIGRRVEMIIGNQEPVTLTIPIISVEVKTYLDATMFGEVKSSSKTLKSATPNSRAFILMGYKCLADEHIIAARQDSTIDEIFVLREGEGQPIDPYALYMYWEEITSSINNIINIPTLCIPGRLLAYNDRINLLRIQDAHGDDR